MLVMIVNHDADFLAAMVFVTRCGHNLAFCFIFIIHTELFPTSFLATSYGLCSFVSRGVTLFAPLIAESANHWVPIGALSITCLLGLIGSLMIKT
jgi:Zn-dependent protease